MDFLLRCGINGKMDTKWKIRASRDTERHAGTTSSISARRSRQACLPFAAATTTAHTLTLFSPELHEKDV